MKEIIVDALRE